MGGANTSKFHDLWICGRQETRIYGFKYTKILLEIQGGFFRNILFLSISKCWKPLFYRFWKRPAPTNDDDLSNKILRILDMGAISIKRM